MLGLGVLLPTCAQTSPKMPAGVRTPDVPAAGTGADAGAPIAIRLIAPARPIDIRESSFEVAREAGDADRRGRRLNTQRRDQGPLPRSGAGSDEKLRALEPVIRKGRQLVQGVHLTLRLTNVSRDPITVHFGGNTSRCTLLVTGPGAIYLPYEGAITADYRLGAPTALKPNESKDFPIRELRSGGRELHRWLIGAPGTYTVRARFTTRLPAHRDPDPDAAKRPFLPDFDNGPEIDLTSNEVTFEVRSAGP